MQTWKIGAIIIATVALAGVFAITAYGYGVNGVGMMGGYSPNSNSQGQNPWGGMGMMGNGMMGNNWQGMMNNCHSNMNQYRQSHMNQNSYCYRYYNNITSQPDQVLIMHYSFVPNIITISEGTTLTWINMDLVVHTVESGTHEQPTELFDSGPLDQGQSFSFTFTETGVYVYHCDPHPYMLGTVIVQ
jgi:plastocyanin